MPLTSAQLDRLLDPFQLPHDDLRFDGREFQRKRDIVKGAAVLASGALSIGKYAYNKMAGSEHKKRKSVTGTNLSGVLESEAMNVDGTTTPTAGQPVVETVSVSSTSTMSKTGRREAFQPSGLDRKQPEMRLAKIAKSIRPKSVWSSLRDLVSGKKVLKNTFCFKLSSAQDQRGLMAIPLRHDATMQNVPVSGGWQVGTQAKYTQSAAGGFGEYETMLLPNNNKVWTPGTEPANDQRGVIIPRLSLPCLEQTSWDLNQLKLVPKNLQDITQETTSNPLGSLHSIMQPVVQLASSGVPLKADGTSYYDPNGIPTANQSFARMQDQGTTNAFPGTGTVSSFPMFKTQLGGGSLKMRVCNQGTNKMTVEFVVLKVATPYIGNIDADTANIAPDLTLSGANCTRIWSQLWRMIGYEHARKVTKNVNYAMGNEVKSVPELMDEPLISPYFPWLGQSLFKAKYPQYWNKESSMSAGTINLAPTNGMGINATTNTSVFPLTSQGNSVQMPQNPTNKLNTYPNPIGSDVEYNGQLAQKCPYRSVSRGHATIAGAAERTITIPIPGSIYNASRIQSYATNRLSTNVDGVLNAQLNDESYIVLMSINGSLQDIIEPNTLDDRVKVIGKAYTEAKADVYCQYTETIYPSCCDYSEITPVAYNLGKVRGPMLSSNSGNAFPGKILPMSHATPTVATGVLRTGASERGGPNEGS